MLKLLFYQLLLSSLLCSCGGENKSPKGSSPQKAQVNSIKKETADPSVKTSNSNTVQVIEQDSKGATPEQLKKAAEIIAEVKESDLAAINSKKLFKMHCSICHGFKGNMEINGAKNLMKSTITQQEAVAQVYHGKGLMVPYKGVLTDAEIVAVSKYTETLRK